MAEQYRDQGLVGLTSLRLHTSQLRNTTSDTRSPGRTEVRVASTLQTNPGPGSARLLGSSLWWGFETLVHQRLRDLPTPVLYRPGLPCYKDSSTHSAPCIVFHAIPPLSS